MRFFLLALCSNFVAEASHFHHHDLLTPREDDNTDSVTSAAQQTVHFKTGKTFTCPICLCTEAAEYIDYPRLATYLEKKLRADFDFSKLSKDGELSPDDHLFKNVNSILDETNGIPVELVKELCRTMYETVSKTDGGNNDFKYNDGEMIIPPDLNIFIPRLRQLIKDAHENSLLLPGVLIWHIPDIGEPHVISCAGCIEQELLQEQKTIVREMEIREALAEFTHYPIVHNERYWRLEKCIFCRQDLERKETRRLMNQSLAKVKARGGDIWRYKTDIDIEENCSSENAGGVGKSKPVKLPLLNSPVFKTKRKRTFEHLRKQAQQEYNGTIQRTVFLNGEVVATVNAPAVAIPNAAVAHTRHAEMVDENFIAPPVILESEGGNQSPNAEEKSDDTTNTQALCLFRVTNAVSIATGLAAAYIAHNHDPDYYIAVALSACAAGFSMAGSMFVGARECGGVGMLCRSLSLSHSTGTSSDPPIANPRGPVIDIEMDIPREEDYSGYGDILSPSPPYVYGDFGDFGNPHWSPRWW